MTTSSGDPFDIAKLWEDYRPTPLVELPRLARAARVGRVFAKLENERPLGNFKSLGGMVAGLRALARAAGVSTPAALRSRRILPRLPQLLCASDGNHGLAVAAAARWARTTATIYLPASVGRLRVERIEALGGRVVPVHGSYDDAVRQAADATADGQGILIADTTAEAGDAVVADVMAGYAVITRELGEQFRETARVRPSHAFVQAGVGGLAAAVAQGLSGLMREPGMLVVVEPESAACVARALEAGHAVSLPGDLDTAAEMLSCGTASVPAVAILQRHLVQPLLVDEDQLRRATSALRQAGGPETTASGAAGLAGLLRAGADAELRARFRLDSSSEALIVISEGAADRMDRVPTSLPE